MKVILVIVMPAVLLLVSADCFGDPTTGCRCEELRCLFSAQGSGKHQGRPADASWESTAQRWSRRLNVQPGIFGFGPTVALAQTPIRPEETIAFCVPALAGLEWIQSWQFLCRAALEPRAPSLVS